MHDELALKTVRLAIEYDFLDSLFGRVDDGEIHFAANCNDLFWWATADAEEITKQNFDLLRQTCEDLKRLEKENEKVFATLYIESLFAARVRKMRPQDACYQNWEKVLWPLFDSCGPERKRDKSAFGNPFGREKPKAASA